MEDSNESFPAEKELRRVVRDGGAELSSSTFFGQDWRAAGQHDTGTRLEPCLVSRVRRLLLLDSVWQRLN